MKTFFGTSPNAVKSQIFIALITYLLLELLRRMTAKAQTAFLYFVEMIRICLPFYLSLDYVDISFCMRSNVLVEQMLKSFT